MSGFRFYALKLVGVIVVIFLMQLFFQGFTETVLLNENSYIEIWRFVTSIFVHGGMVHLLYNIFALGLFGSILERLIGGKKFLIVFFVSGVLANLVSVNFYSSSLGASGAIFGVIGALMIIRPGVPVFAFGIPMPVLLAGILWSIGDVLGAYGFFTGNPIDNTGNIAHLSGLFFGLIFGGYLRDWRKKKKKGASIDEEYIRKWEDYFMKDV